MTKAFLQKLSLSQKNIVIELNEKTSIENYRGFKLALDHYREQGYKIAIDDTGAGYSGLQSIVSIPFDYIKIDRSLICNIDNDQVKQALLEAFIKFTERINSRIIAEGIERKEELDTLINLGVDYAQGYLIEEPAAEMKETFSISTYINKKVEIKDFNCDNSNIGEISLLDTTISAEVDTDFVVRAFENNEKMQSIVVTKKEKPVGLIMRDKLYYRLGTKYGYAVYNSKAE